MVCCSNAEMYFTDIIFYYLKSLGGFIMGETKKINLVHYIIVAAFCFLFRFVPGFAGITPYGMGILGCFIGAIYGWMTIGMF